MSGRNAERMQRGSPARDARLVAAISSWFEANARPFPWRPTRGKRDPYVSLVSEVMLQQTQASRVAERLPGFLERFPSVRTLAEASEDDVLAAWAGLGYYRRARTLHACAKEIVSRHNGRLPRLAAELRALPGIGPYSAGSLASIVFGQREPIVDANVARVALRIEGVEASPKEPAVVRWLWERARDLVRRAERPDLLNEGLMELGALVCTPKSPRCGACPVARSCRARRNGTVDAIPLTASGGKKRTIHHAAVIVRDEDGRVLMERRPEGGLWAAHWQLVALERQDRAANASELRAALGVGSLRRVGASTRMTSAARVEITLYQGKGTDGRRGEWIDADRLATLPIAGPHRGWLGLDGRKKVDRDEPPAGKPAASRGRAAR